MFFDATSIEYPVGFHHVEGTTIQPGHADTVEPGLYTDTAGYCHSDTVAVTASGTEWLT